MQVKSVLGAGAIALALVVVSGTGGAVAGALITGAQIKDGTVTTADIRNGTLTSADVLDSALLGADVRNGTLTGADIADGSVGPADVAGLTGADIMDESINLGDIHPDVFHSYQFNIRHSMLPRDPRPVWSSAGIPNLNNPDYNSVWLYDGSWVVGLNVTVNTNAPADQYGFNYNMPVRVQLVRSTDENSEPWDNGVVASCTAVPVAGLDEATCSGVGMVNQGASWKSYPTNISALRIMPDGRRFYVSSEHVSINVVATRIARCVDVAC